jgi:hypothetical protein
MADEFAKGLGILTTGFLGWMVVAAWYKTPSFEGTQLIAAPPEDPGLYGQLALYIGESMLWFGLFGALTFWFLLPLFNEFRDYLDSRAN